MCANPISGDQMAITGCQLYTETLPEDKKSLTDWNNQEIRRALDMAVDETGELGF